MDRFLLKEVIDYLEADHEFEVLNRFDDGSLGKGTDVTAVVGPEIVRHLQKLTQRVYVDPSIKRYIVALVGTTRRTSTSLPAELRGYVEMGASPRGTIAFFQAARALALLSGRNHVLPEDVRELRHGVLRHRIHLTFEALAERVRVEEIIDAVFKAVPSP